MTDGWGRRFYPLYVWRSTTKLPAAAVRERIMAGNMGLAPILPAGKHFCGIVRGRWFLLLRWRWDRSRETVLFGRIFDHEAGTRTEIRFIDVLAFASLAVGSLAALLTIDAGGWGRAVMMLFGVLGAVFTLPAYGQEVDWAVGELTRLLEADAEVN